MASKKVLVVGASGGVGGSLLHKLLALPNPPSIRVSTRTLGKVAFPASVEVIQGDLEDPSSYSRLFNGVERAFIYANAEAPLDQLMSAAKDSGVKYIVLLSALAVVLDPEGPIAKMHIQVEDAIKNAGLSYTFLRAGVFFTNSRNFWSQTMKKTGKVWLTYHNAPNAPLSDDDIAGVALVALTTDKLVDQAIALTGNVVMTQQQQVEAINRLRQREGQKPIDMISLSPEDWKTRASVHMPASQADQLIKLWEISFSKPETILSTEQVIDKPSQSYEEWLELNKENFLDS